MFWAAELGADVEEMELFSQFQCNGSDGYLAWIDHVLGIRETAHVDLSTPDYDYDFQVLGSPNEVRRILEEKNAEAGRARVAGSPTPIRSARSAASTPARASRSTTWAPSSARTWSCGMASW